MSIERAYDADNVIVPCNDAARTGQGRPVLVTHGLMCDLTFARLIGHHLNPMAVFGFQGTGIARAEPPLHTVSEIVACFLEAGLQHCPSGPYVIVAFCAGAQIGLELATELRMLGRSVDCVFLIDAPYKMRPGEFVTLARQQAMIAQRRVENYSDEQRRKFSGVPASVRAFCKAVATHPGRAYSGRAELIVSEELHPLIIDPDLGWSNQLRSDTKIYVVGRDRSDLLISNMAKVSRIIRSAVASN